MSTFIYRFLLLCAISNTAFSQTNQLINPGFEAEADGWSFFGGERSTSSHSGTSSLKVSLEKANWAGADQTVRFPKNTATVEVKGWMKTDNVVRGSNPWELARIAVEFFDENGTQVGGYPPVVGNAESSTDWKHYENTYDVPKGAAQVKVQVALGNCTGTAFFDDLELYLRSSTGAEVGATKATGPADWGSWYTIASDPAKTGSHYADWSSLLDAPAGKHGFAKVKEGRIAFEDGTPVRFWGTNLVAGKCFLDKKAADSLALRLSKMGCNLLRLHHMDAPWAIPNIFGNADGTRQLSSQSIDKLDYLIAALKKKGIYVFLDLLVHRDFKTEDGILNRPPDLGGKQVGYFDEQLIRLQKEYIKQLLTHKNPYTGLAYKDEPSIVASEFINESSAFLHFQGDLLTPEYRNELTEKFKTEVANENKSLSVFELDYSTYLSPVMKTKLGQRGDVTESIKFLSGIEKSYYKTMESYMRSLGVKYLLSGSNFPNPILAYQKDNTILDLITTNDYWDHPQIWKINNDWDRIEYAPFNNTSILKNYPTGPINNISKYRWKDKPFIVTEYNICYPNEYRLEGLPYIAAYSRLQGFDGLLQFNFDPEVTNTNRSMAFALNNMPEHLAQWVVAAPLFLRGDIKEAPSFVADQVTDQQAYSLPSYSDFIDKNTFLPLVTKVGKQTVDASTTSNAPSFEKFVNKTTGDIKSETNELCLNKTKGLFSIHSPKVQGVAGALKDSTFSFPLFQVAIKNPWASVFAISKDNLSLADSKSFYLVVCTPVRTKGMQYANSRSSLKEIGELPLQAQFAMGKISFLSKGKKLTVYPLSLAGTKAPPTILTDGVLNLYNHKSFVFEVKVGE
jgi:hypothetical protein